MSLDALLKYVQEYSLREIDDGKFDLIEEGKEWKKVE